MNQRCEEQFILEVIDAYLKGKPYPPSKLSNRLINTEKLVCFLQTNGISHIFFDAIKNNQGIRSWLGEPLLEKLRAGYYSNLKKNIISINELEKLIKELKTQHIDIIIFKGAALIESVYSDIGLRGMSDIDILIKPKDYKTIHKTLHALGYIPLDKTTSNKTIKTKPYLNTLLYHKTNAPFFLHIHWHFVNSTLPTHAYIGHIDINKLWEMAKSQTIGGTKGLVLAPHHLLIHLLEHGMRVRHSFSKLILIIDIVEALNHYQSSINWDKFLKDTREFHLNQMIYSALYLCQKYFSLNLPQHILPSLETKHFSVPEKIFLNLTDKGVRYPGLSYLIHLAQNKGLDSKIHFLFRTFFPPQSVQKHRSYQNKKRRFLDRFIEVTRQAGKALLHMQK